MLRLASDQHKIPYLRQSFCISSTGSTTRPQAAPCPGDGRSPGSPLFPAPGPYPAVVVPRAFANLYTYTLRNTSELVCYSLGKLHARGRTKSLAYRPFKIQNRRLKRKLHPLVPDQTGQMYQTAVRRDNWWHRNIVTDRKAGQTQCTNTVADSSLSNPLNS